MEITEIRIKLMESSEDRLRAFCSITIDACFVVRDLKIIDGTSGPFVAMPSRKLSGHCRRCHYKNHLRASYCNHCGVKLSSESGNDFDSPQKLYADVAHPINSECREMIQNAVIEEFQAELSRSRQPGYRSRYDDDFDLADSTTRNRGTEEKVFVDAAHSKHARDSTGHNSNSQSTRPSRPKLINPSEAKEASATSADEKDQATFGEGIF